MHGTKLLVPNSVGTESVVWSGYTLPAYELGEKVGYQSDKDNIESYKEAILIAAYPQYIIVDDTVVCHFEYELDNTDHVHEDDIICIVGE